MNILFVIDRIELKYFEFNNLVTNFWMIKEFLQRDETVFITTIDNLSIKRNKPHAKCYKAYLKDETIAYDYNLTDCKIEDFELLLFRPDPPVDNDYINATYILDFIDTHKTLMLNSPSAIRNFNEKLHALKFAEYMPENIVTANKKDIEDFLEEHNEIILKPLNNCFGTGVMHLTKNDKNKNTIIKTLTNNGTNLIMVQKYLEAVKYGDTRVLTLGNEILDECVHKLPCKNDFKFSVHSDDYIKKATLTENEKSQFTYVAKKLDELGIVMAGLDVIDSQIIEINVTSPCYFIKEINNYFSTHLEKRICDYILKKAQSRMALTH